MRVGLLIYGSLDTISGGYLYDRKLVEYLRGQGEQVQVVSLPWRSYPQHLGDNLSNGLLRRLAHLEIDVLVQDELNHPSLFWLNRRLRPQVSYPLVALVHHLRSSEACPAWQNRFYRWVERSYLNSVDAFIYNSQTTHQVVEALTEAPRPGVVAYPAGDRFAPPCDPQEIARRAQAPGPLRLLFLGNLIRRKGLHTLLAALEQIPSPEWQLTVAGRLEADSAYARLMQARVRAVGLQGQVHFAGALSDSALADTMRASHVLVVPSSYEGFGIVYLEGMGFGLPGVATRAGAAAEIITHGENGFLIDPDDAPALAACLAGLARDRGRLASLGQAAQRRYAAHPTWSQSMGLIHRFLRGLVQAPEPT